ncbi:hypothetical protein Hdeb2414_s0003g00110771 [Helianthus debilis subsp. tardiflorus]
MQEYLIYIKTHTILKLDEYLSTWGTQERHGLYLSTWGTQEAFESYMRTWCIHETGFMKTRFIHKLCFHTKYTKMQTKTE